MSASALLPEQHVGWWTKPALLIAVIVLAGAPLWWPTSPPLTDLLGHMGRYAVQLDAGHAPQLARWYQFEWHWIGNLGVDLLVQVLGPLFGVEIATKLIAILIPMLTVAGFLAVAREAHGQVPPTAFFALPLAYSYPFLWGFVNFALSMALAFLAFALWLRLGRLGHLRLRFVLFLPLSLVLWTAHMYGWATFGVLAASAELTQNNIFQRQWARAFWASVRRCACLLPPLVPMVFQFSAGGAGGQPWGRVWFNLDLKSRWALSIFRDRWEWFDTASLGLLMAVVAVAVVRKTSMARSLILAASILLSLYLLIPHSLLGSAYADMRLAPYVLAVALLAIGQPRSRAGLWAGVALAFFGLRLLGTALSAYDYDQSYRRELAALDHIPMGARLLSLVGRPCHEDWAVHRLDHLPSVALVRRHAFANDQWDAQGAQLISVRYAAAGPFQSDPSQFVVQPRCARAERRAFADAIAQFPRGAFDYVWIIQQPETPADMKELEPIWQNGRSALYRVVRTK